MSGKTSKFIRHIMKTMNIYQKQRVKELWDKLQPNEKAALQKEIQTAERLSRKEHV